MVHGREWTARIGVLTVIEEEFDALSETMGGLDERLLSYYAPPNAWDDVVVKRCPARGTHTAGNEARDMIELFRPEILIVCGIAGAVGGKDLELGDVVIADYLHYSEFRKLVDNEDETAGFSDELRYVAYDQPSIPLRSRYVERLRADKTQAWRDDIIETPPKESKPKIETGAVVVGEKVMGSVDHPEVVQATKNFPGAIAYEMESYGVAHAIHNLRATVDYDPLLLVVRGISDVVDRETEEDEDSATESNHQQRATWKPYAAATAAAVSNRLIQALLSTPDPRSGSRATVNS